MSTDTTEITQPVTPENCTHPRAIVTITQNTDIKATFAEGEIDDFDYQGETLDPWFEFECPDCHISKLYDRSRNMDNIPASVVVRFEQTRDRYYSH